MRIQENKLNNLSVLYICSKFVYSLFAVCFCNTFPVCVHCPCYVPVLDWIIFFLLCLLNKKRIKNNSNCTADRELHAGLHWAGTLDWYAGGMPPIFSEWAIWVVCLAHVIVGLRVDSGILYQPGIAGSAFTVGVTEWERHTRDHHHHGCHTRIY